LREGLIARGVAAALVSAGLLLHGSVASAQVTPATGYTPPDDTPTIKVGATIFADYTFQSEPEIPDSDGNLVNPNSFNVARAYINVTGNISHLLAFRITPDIAREAGTGSTLLGSQTYRLKYAYAQFNLDDWMTKGTWVRLGVQQTPWVDFEEQIYRYRFQGTIFTDRETFLSSSDVGVAFHTNIPKNYGDVIVGVYNGETYSRPEANDQKAFQIRGTLRPLPMSANFRGLRLTAFYDADHYVKNAERQRFIVAPTFEHKYLNAAFQWVETTDQISATTGTKVEGQGWSFWATPRTEIGIEGLIRFDHLEPDDATDRKRERAIFGVAYWLPHQGTVSSAFLLDYEQVENKNFPAPVPRQQRIALHALVNF
jgi:Phosphate-selective porin O and P